MAIKSISFRAQSWSVKLLSAHLSRPALSVRLVRTIKMTPSIGDVHRGLLIVFEGCDKCGKSTQSSLLVKYLESNNVPVKCIAFPNRESQVSGKLIDAYLTNKQDMSDQSIHLLFTVNRWELHNKMKSLLESGTTLVLDRYSYSGVAYSVAKGLDLEWCMGPEKGLIQPDLVFYMNGNIDSLSDRGNFGEERYEKREFQSRVSSVFEKLYEKEKHYWRRIDANQSMEVIQKQIAKEVENVFKDVTKKYHMNVLWA